MCENVIAWLSRPALHTPHFLSAQPLLPYTAPELISDWGGGASSASPAAVTPAADAFSLAAVAYELLAVSPTAALSSAGPSSSAPSSQLPGSFQQLLPVRSSVHEYRARVPLLEGGDLQGCPVALKGMVNKCGFR